MRISDWSSDVCSSDLTVSGALGLPIGPSQAAGKSRPTMRKRDAAEIANDGSIGVEHEPLLTLVTRPYTGIPARSEERRVGQECASTGRSHRSPLHYKKKLTTLIIQLRQHTYHK